ncbi:Protein TIC 20-v, chloroplastic [Dionaea muscipula]
MATSAYLLFSPRPLNSPHRTYRSSSSSSSPCAKNHPSFLSLATKVPRPRRAVSVCVESKKNNDLADAPDRLISAICYFYPFFDGIQYGRYVITQFAPFQVLIQPLIPAIRAFKSFPLNGFLVFLTLYFVVVRNQNFSRYVRFNTMQAIVLDVLLIVPDLLERSFNPGEGLGLDLIMSLDSTVFLFLLVSLIYGSSTCALGQVPRLPIVAEAAERCSRISGFHIPLL